MKELTDKVVRVKSIADQIIEAPVETVIVVHSKTDYGAIVGDALVKTGIDGYRWARNPNTHKKYLTEDDISKWVRDFGADATFYMI